MGKRKYIEDTRSAEYAAWRSMIKRCYQSSNKSYSYYGGRGIAVCDLWRVSFDAFYKDMGKKPNPLLTLERKDNEKGYGPDNCKWATRSEQRKNQRYLGRKLKPVQLKPCLQCGKKIPRVKPVRYKKRRFCSRKCGDLFRLTVTLEDRHCLACGKVIAMPKHEHPGKYMTRKYCDHICLGIGQRGILRDERLSK